MDERRKHETLGRYEILEELGRGAMGVVYLARDPIIGRRVALKVLRLPAMAGAEEREQFRKRFIREAQSAGILAHPNIVTVHDVSEGEEGEEGPPTFIAMEHIQGTDLKELLRSGNPLDLAFASEVIGQIAMGLDFAHSQGVVHRDIKPANILITEEGQVKITDFGIARIDTSNLTQDTQLLGTPNYMAPEQIQGTETDHRVDVFALGVLLYEMITGQKPFQGENVTEVTHRIVYEEHRPVTERVAELPGGLDKILLRALAKRPEDRYDRAGDLAAELTEIVKTSGDQDNLNATQIVEPVAADQTGGRAAGAGDESGTLERAWDGLRSPRGLVLAATVVLVLGLGIGGSVLWLQSGDAEPTSQPEPPPPDPRLKALVREGHRLLSDGNPYAAAQSFRDAERLAPERTDIRGWRELAENQAEAFERMTERQRQLGRKLAAGQLALTDGRYEDALKEVEEALGLAGDEESVAQAEEIRRQVEKALRQRAASREAAARRAEEENRRRREQEARRLAAAQAATEQEAEPPPEPTPPAAPAGDPTLEMEFVSEQPQGNLAIWVGETRFLNQQFRFVERKGFLGLGSEAYEGQLYLEPTPVPTGRYTVRVYVTPRGQAAQATILENVEFKPGDGRRLEIFLSQTGEVTAKLE